MMGIPAFLELLEKLEKAKNNKKAMERLVKKFTNQLGVKFAVFLEKGKQYILSIIQNFEIQSFRLPNQKQGSSSSHYTFCFSLYW